MTQVRIYSEQHNDNQTMIVSRNGQTAVVLPELHPSTAGIFRSVLTKLQSRGAKVQSNGHTTEVRW